MLRLAHLSMVECFRALDALLLQSTRLSAPGFRSRNGIFRLWAGTAFERLQVLCCSVLGCHRDGQLAAAAGLWLKRFCPFACDRRAHLRHGSGHAFAELSARNAADIRDWTAGSSQRPKCRSALPARQDRARNAAGSVRSARDARCAAPCSGHDCPLDGIFVPGWVWWVHV